jgi:hypothetical protein
MITHWDTAAALATQHQNELRAAAADSRRAVRRPLFGRRRRS